MNDIKNNPSLYTLFCNLGKQVNHLDELEMKMQLLTGYTIEEVIAKFAAGWVLVPREKFIKNLNLGNFDIWDELMMKGESND